MRPLADLLSCRPNLDPILAFLASFRRPEMIAPDKRAIHLRETRNLKMARSAHVYGQGSTTKFYDWLEASPTGVRSRPAVWIWGLPRWQPWASGRRQGPSGVADPRPRPDWLFDLTKARTANLEAPSWLWSSVVDLLGVDERAYLEHWRVYALAQAA